jgi:hypothetical protein
VTKHDWSEIQNAITLGASVALLYMGIVGLTLERCVHCSWEHYVLKCPLFEGNYVCKA